MKYAKRMLALTLIVLPILAAAQMASNTRIVAKVPFPFVVGDKHVPAGQWTVESIAPGTVMIRNVAAKVGLLSPAHGNETKKASGTYALVFNKYGDRAFLTGIRLAGDRSVYQIPEGRAEAELRAQNTSSTEEILLASKQ
jgi:hypothetical protein